MREPRIRSTKRSNAPFELGDFPPDSIITIAKEIVYMIHTRRETRLEGDDWERIFAESIGGQWRPSNLGLDDVQLGSCCWGAKTVKHKSPATADYVRLISGRNSLDYSYKESDSRGCTPEEIGDMVLGIWNARVSQVRERFQHVRTIVLARKDDLTECAIFEYETEEYTASEFIWAWNKRGNLEGHDSDGNHRFTWQPHGAQFTIVEKVPKNRIAFRLKSPPLMSKSDVLHALGFDETWVELLD